MGGRGERSLETGSTGSESRRLSCVGWQTHNFLQAALMPMELKARGEVEYSLNGVEISNPTGRANL